VAKVSSERGNIVHIALNDFHRKARELLLGLFRGPCKGFYLDAPGDQQADKIIPEQAGGSGNEGGRKGRIFSHDEFILSALSAQNGYDLGPGKVTSLHK
jgi:hypothetical protein